LVRRERSRIKEFEDACIANLQGPAFVGDEALQKTYSVLNSRDRRLGDELVRVIRIIGKPDDLEKLVTQILSRLAYVFKNALEDRMVPQVATWLKDREYKAWRWDDLTSLPVDEQFGNRAI
jgi:hypothetical protein